MLNPDDRYGILGSYFSGIVGTFVEFLRPGSVSLGFLKLKISSHGTIS